jgi:hypothetical protein
LRSRQQLARVTSQAAWSAQAGCCRRRRRRRHYSSQPASRRSMCLSNDSTLGHFLPSPCPGGCCLLERNGCEILEGYVATRYANRVLKSQQQAPAGQRRVISIGADTAVSAHATPECRRLHNVQAVCLRPAGACLAPGCCKVSFASVNIPFHAPGHCARQWAVSSLLWVVSRSPTGSGPLAVPPTSGCPITYYDHIRSL